jgi:hypothetical protein
MFSIAPTSILVQAHPMDSNAFKLDLNHHRAATEGLLRSTASDRNHANKG